MRAQLKTWDLGRAVPEPRVHHFPNGDVLIEAAIVSPASAVGRGVDIHVTAELVPELLKALRTAAIQLRNTPMS